MKRSLFGMAAGAMAAAALNLSMLAVPAAAGECGTPNCGGEVDNNAGRNVAISNCWADSYGTWENGDSLPCHGRPARTGNQANAMTWLAPGEREDMFSRYYDTDAVRFTSGCTTYYHFWGWPTRVEDRSGRDSIWMKINSADHLYVERVVC
ncbi:hypothetical protein [Streptomyces sp. NPDC089919]|uniref:hypothetical protein n=1 Tax=Streptomyces sp. NPDC089919 TaxID=3155188 RepID=UPI0034389D33